MSIRLVAALILLSVLTSCNAPQSSQGASTAPPVQVKTARTEQRLLPQQISIFGGLYAPYDADISSKINAEIVALPFHAGERVKAGTLLIQLESQAQEAELAQAQAEEKLSQLEYDRALALRERNAVSQQDLDVLSSTLAIKKAQVQLAKVQLAKTRLVAPFAGRLGAKHYSKGDYVSAGTTLLTIVDNRQLRVVYHLPERWLHQLSLGQEMRVESLAFPDESFHGVVDYIAPMIDEATRSIAVEASIDNSAEKLSPGLSVNVLHSFAAPQESLLIPEEALVYSIEGQAVYRVVEQEENQFRVERVFVETGRHVQGKVVITKGLQLADQVVVQGQQKLREGLFVRPQLEH